MYNYHADIVWAIDIAFVAILSLTCIVIFFSVLFKEHLWQKRRSGLVALKRNVYETALAYEEVPESVYLTSISEITPQQYIDIETNRNIDAAFFNETEQKFFRACFIKPENIDRLIGVVKQSQNKWKKIEAILCLGYAKAEPAVGVIRELIFSKDADIVYFSMVSLGQIKTVQSGRALLDYLQKDPTNGYKIVAMLGDFPRGIVEDIVKLINYHDTMVRFWALTLLTKFVSPEHIKKIEILTHNESAEVRAAACDCLGSTHNIESTGALIKCLKDDSWLVRCHAILALSKVMKDAAIPQIVGLINDASWSVVDEVKNVMAEYIEASLPYIETFLAGENEIPKKYSVLALQNSGYLAKLVYKAASGTAKDDEVKILRGVVKSGIHGGLDAALNELQPDMREKALEALSKIKEA